MDRQLIVVMVTAYMMERELTMDMPEFKHKPRELEYMPNDGGGGRRCGREGEGGPERICQACNVISCHMML